MTLTQSGLASLDARRPQDVHHRQVLGASDGRRWPHVYLSHQVSDGITHNLGRLCLESPGRTTPKRIPGEETLFPDVRMKALPPPSSHGHQFAWLSSPSLRLRVCDTGHRLASPPHPPCSLLCFHCTASPFSHPRTEPRGLTSCRSVESPGCFHQKTGSCQLLPSCRNVHLRKAPRVVRAELAQAGTLPARLGAAASASGREPPTALPAPESPPGTPKQRARGKCGGIAGSMAGGGQEEGLVSFEDVIVCFSRGEWRLLSTPQKELYWEMLRETYKALVLVGGRLITSAEVFAWVEKNERLNVPKPVKLLDEPPSGILSATDADRSPTGMESFPEQGGPLEATRTPSKEETAGRSDAEGSPEHSRVSAVGGSVFDSGGSLSRAESESARRVSGNASPEEVPLPCQLRAELPQMPVPIAAPEKSSEQKSCPRGTTVLPQPDLATHAEDRLEEMQLAHAACDENRKDSLWPPSAPALAQSTERAQGPQLQPPEVPAEEEKLFSCGWCKEQFKLQMNLETHNRYCRQRERQQPGPPANPLRPPRVPGKQGPSGSGSTGGSAGPPLPPAAPARSPSSGKFLKFILCQPQRKQKTGKHRGIPHLGRDAADSPRSLAMVSVTKKLFRCQECGEKFVYKWQLFAHLRAHAERGSCGEDTGGQSPLPKQARDQAAGRAHDGARSREACVAPAVLRRRAQARPLYPCGECGRSFTKHYLPTHRAFHAGLRYKCLLCGKVFNFQSGAQLHKKRHREKGDSATCPKCGKSAGAKDCFCMIKKISITPKPDCGEGRGQADEPR
ncbi:uncharacterized protein PHA67_016255 [Liasis olivaceus]